MKLETYVKIIQRFNASSIIDMVVRESASLWKKNQVQEEMTDGNPYSLLLRAYGHKVASLAYAFGDFRSGPEIDNETFKKLINSYVEIEESFATSNEDHYRLLEAIQDHALCKDIPRIKEFLSVDLAKDLNTVIIMSRSMTSQWSMVTLQIAIERQLAIFFEFEKNISPADALLIRKYLGMEPIIYIKTAYAISAILYSNHIDGSKDGFLAIKDDSLARHFSSEMDITADDVKYLANKLSSVHGEFTKTTREEILKGKEDAKYFQSLFSKLPLLKAADDGWTLYLCPSPWFLSIKLVNFLSDYFGEVFGQRSKEIRDKWGEASCHILKNIISSLRKDACFVDIDLVEKERKNKFADLILFEDGRALIIELKTAIGNITDKNFVTPKSLAKILLTQTLALEQCHETKKRISKYVTTSDKLQCAYLVVTAQQGVREGEFVHVLNHSTKFFKSESYDPFDVINIDDLETALCNYKVSEIVDILKLNDQNRKNHQYEKIQNIYERKEKIFVPAYEEMKKLIFRSLKE